MKLYAAAPAHAPDDETTVFLAPDLDTAHETARRVLKYDQTTGYGSPTCDVWEIDPNPRWTGFVITTE